MLCIVLAMKKAISILIAVQTVAVDTIEVYDIASNTWTMLPETMAQEGNIYSVLV